MKVLLLSEMSGVHSELSAGLKYHGIDVDLACHGDGFKKYESSINLGRIDGSLYSHYDRAIRQLNLSLGFKSYDVIQTISPNPFYRGISKYIEDKMLSSKAKKIYVAAGSDSIYRKHVKELDYYPPHNWNERVKSYEKLYSQLSHFDNIIPVCWEYNYSILQSKLNCSDVIPFPINLEKYQPVTKKTNKIVVYHPLNRVNLEYDFKGTLLIKEVFEKLKMKYSNIAEFICKGNMTHQEYNEFTNSVDIIVDQCYSYSYGMSGAIALAKGQVVLSGAEGIIKKGNIHYNESPIINIKPNFDDIYIKIENLILNKSKIKLLQESSRAFSEKYHCHKNVANKYIEKYCK